LNRVLTHNNNVVRSANQRYLFGVGVGVVEVAAALGGGGVVVVVVLLRLLSVVVAALAGLVAPFGKVVGGQVPECSGTSCI
jgi:hypothetical protein